jgi:hypothetical protein
VDLRSYVVLMTAYEKVQNVVSKEIVPAGGEPEAAIGRLPASPEVRYIEVRNPDAGCRRQRHVLLWRTDDGNLLQALLRGAATAA